MAERSVVVRLAASVAEFKRGMGEAKSATEAVGKATEETGAKGSKSFGDLLTWVDKNEQHLNALTTQVGLVGVGLTAFAALSIKAAADFDAAMSSVQAATMESASNMVLLRQAAIDAGADTAYSAVEAAGAIEELAKAGVSTSDILAGGLAGALDLAASGAIDVSAAAEVAASTMTQFGLSGRDVTHIADVLAAGAGKAQGGVLDLGNAMKYAGIPAAQLGISLEETAGTISLFASNGIIGEQAGTSFRSMLQSLTAPTQVGAKAMDEYGISMFDATGKFIGMQGAAQVLQDRLGGLTDAERTAALGRIVGNEALGATNALMKAGAEGVREWTAAVDDQGYAAEQARIRTDNLRGDIERLGGSIDTAFIQSGSGANSVLRELAQGAEAVVDQIGQLPEPLLNATTLLTGASGLAALGVAGLGKLTVAVASTKAAMQELNISTKAAGVSAAAIGGALAIGTYMLSQWAEAAAESKQNTDDFKSTLDQTNGAVTRSTSVLIAQKVAQSDVGRVYANMGGDLGDLTQAVLGNADAIERVNTLLDAQPKEKFLWTESDLAGVASVRDGVQGLSDDLARSQEEFEREKSAVDAVGGSMSATQSALEQYSAAQQTGTATTEDYASALEELIDLQAKAAGVVMDLWSAQNQLEAAYDAATDALTDNGVTLDVTTEKGRANREALLSISSAGWDLIESMRANGATQAELQTQISATRERFVAAATAFGMSSDEANALADSMNLIPSAVNVQVNANTAAAAANLDDIWTKVTRLDGKVVTTNVRTNETTVRTVVGGTGPTGNWAAQANGGVLDFFADGAENHVAQIAPAGAWRVWAEPETGGEGYIPLAPSKRERSEEIMSSIADRFGGQYIPSGSRRYDSGGTAGLGAELRGYDKGGYVTPAAAVSVPTATAGSGVSVHVAAPSLDGARLVGTLDLGNGLTGLIDARVDAGLAQQRRDMAGTRGGH